MLSLAVFLFAAIAGQVYNTINLSSKISARSRPGQSPWWTIRCTRGQNRNPSYVCRPGAAVATVRLTLATIERVTSGEHLGGAVG